MAISKIHLQIITKSLELSLFLPFSDKIFSS